MAMCLPYLPVSLTDVAVVVIRNSLRFRFRFRSAPVQPLAREAGEEGAFTI